jgi:hypothetical protein
VLDFALWLVLGK